jgi:hypothetical protein
MAPLEAETADPDANTTSNKTIRFDLRNFELLAGLTLTKKPLTGS